MLAARIEAVAPAMPLDIRRWFLERNYAIPNVQEQDRDLVLADWDYVELLIEYSEDESNNLEKRVEAFSALMVLQGNESEVSRKKSLSQEIKRIILGNRDFAHKVSSSLGVIESLIVATILGQPMPKDVPEWMLEEVMRRELSGK